MAMNQYDRDDLITVEAYFGTFPTVLAEDARPGATTITVRSAAMAANYTAAAELRIGGIDADGGETVTVASVSGRIVTLASPYVGLWHAAGSSVGKLADTVTVGLEVLDPSGAITPYTAGDIDHSTTGYYSMDMTVDASKEWAYRWLGVGGASGAGWRTLYVRPDPFE